MAVDGLGSGLNTPHASGEALWFSGGVADRATGKGDGLPCVQPHPAGAAAACVRGAGAVGSRFLDHRASRARQREEPMTTTDIILLIEAFAAIVAAVAQMIIAMRRSP